jgi:hypothetical protein
MSESDEDDPFKGLVLSGELNVQKEERERLERELEHAEQRDLERLEEYRRGRDVDGG